MKLRQGLYRAKLKLYAAVIAVGRFLFPPLAGLRRALFPPKNFLKCLEGTTAGGEPITILCGAENQMKTFLVNLIFQTPVRETDAGTFKLPQIFRGEVKTDCSLIIVENKPTHHAWLDDGTWFFIPNWVQGEVSLPIPDKFLKNERVKSDVRKIRRHGYEYEVTRDEAKFEDFYQNMHLPYIGRVHGTAACFDSYAEKRLHADDCDLLLVKKDGRAIAGIMIIYREPVPRLWSLGIRDGDLALAREGVTPALYHFSIEYLAGKGFDRIHMGGSRAFLNDGVIQFKKKMSQKLVGSVWPGVSLKIVKFTPATKSFLQKNPFIFSVAGSLNGAVFIDEEITPETLARLEKDFFYPGLKKLVIYSFRDEVTTPVFSATPSGALEIRSARELV